MCAGPGLGAAWLSLMCSAVPCCGGGGREGGADDGVSTLLRAPAPSSTWAWACVPAAGMVLARKGWWCSRAVASILRWHGWGASWVAHARAPLLPVVAESWLPRGCDGGHGGCAAVDGLRACVPAGDALLLCARVPAASALCAGPSLARRLGSFVSAAVGAGRATRSLLCAGPGENDACHPGHARASASTSSSSVLWAPSDVAGLPGASAIHVGHGGRSSGSVSGVAVALLEAAPPLLCAPLCCAGRREGDTSAEAAVAQSRQLGAGARAGSLSAAAARAAEGDLDARPLSLASMNEVKVSGFAERDMHAPVPVSKEASAPSSLMALNRLDAPAMASLIPSLAVTDSETTHV